MTAEVNEPEAAAFLGLSVRTLRNYRTQGRLPYREVKGRTRPVIVYNQADLEKLKVDLERRRRRSKKPRGTSPQLPRVTFGMPSAELDELRSEAERYGMTTAEYARRLVRERLESLLQQEVRELRAELEKTNGETRKMRKEFSLAFEAILEYVGLSPAEAKQWVDDNVR